MIFCFKSEFSKKLSCNLDSQQITLICACTKVEGEINMVNKIRHLRAIFSTACTGRLDTVAMLPSAFALCEPSIGNVSTRDQVIQVAVWCCNNTISYLDRLILLGKLEI